MSDIQKVRDAITKVEGYVAGEYVVLSKKAIVCWHIASTFVGAIVGAIIRHYL